jgi:hypothetical protein
LCLSTGASLQISPFHLPSWTRQVAKSMSQVSIAILEVQGDP